MLKKHLVALVSLAAVLLVVGAGQALGCPSMSLDQLSFVGLGFGYLMRAPGAAVGQQVIFPDGSTATTDANGFVAVASQFISQMLAAGLTPWPAGKFTTITPADANYQGLGSELIGADRVTARLVTTLTAGRNYTLPTVANLLAAIPANALAIGTTWRFRLINQQAGAFAYTVVTNTGWTTAGTLTIAQNTWREFDITITGAAAASLQEVGTGSAS